jgi:hypothetical protein
LATSLRDDVQITHGILAAPHRAGAAGGQRCVPPFDEALRLSSRVLSFGPRPPLFDHAGEVHPICHLSILLDRPADPKGAT